MRTVVISIVLSFFITSILYSQERVKDNFQGKVYSNLFKPKEFKTWQYIECRTDGKLKYCHYTDTVSHKRFLVCSSEDLIGDSIQYRIIDYVKIEDIPTTQFLIIGSIEIKDAKDNAIFAIEDRPYKDKSIKIYKAWEFDKRTLNLMAKKVEGLYRIHEGFYVK